MPTPTMLFWNGITPRAKSESLDKPLKAEIRDPLWMLCRQWQFGEFIGEDAARPTFAQVKYNENFPVWRKEGGIEEATAKNNLPINAWVEASPFELDLTIKIEIGQHWIKMLQRSLIENKASIIDAFYNTELLQFELPKSETDEQKLINADILSNDSLMNMLITARNLKAIDGEKLLAIIISEPSLSKHILQTQAENEVIDSVGTKLLAWVKKVYNFQLDKSKTWQESRMEYQFDLCATEKEDQQLCLKAEEYWGGEMDWYQFDFKEEETAIENAPTSQMKEAVNIPTQVNYIGMPKTRWWEVEESTVNFGNIKATKDNPTLLLFTQFSLVYGNDWFLVPLHVQTGTITNVKEIIVTDDFGFRTRIKPTPKSNDGLWNFFNFQNLDTSKHNSNWFYFPNTASKIQKSEPVELVNFVRDEMANMVWAIESKIPDHMGRSLEGKVYSNTVNQYIAENIQQPNKEILDNPAKVKYQIATTGPENWIPFIPVKMKNNSVDSRQVQLQRASMPRIVDGHKPIRIRPKTALLSKGLTSKDRKPFYIFEEEIPRSGSIVKGQWKRARWLNGKTVTWYSYEKTNGRGEGNSGLKFDQLLAKQGK